MGSWARGTGAAVVLVFALVAVGGCDPTDEPTDPVTTTSSALPDETSTELPTTPVVTPPDVEEPTAAPEASTDDHVGAIWAARYFLDLYAYMLQTGDTAEFEAISAPECEFCSSQVDAAEGRVEDGSWIEGGAIEFDIAEATAEYPTDAEPNYLVRFDGTELPSTTHRSDGSSDTKAGGELAVVVALQFVNGRFVVFGVNAE